MGDEAFFSVMSKCFAPVSEEEWGRLTRGRCWSDFLDAARRLLQDDSPLGAASCSGRRVRWLCPLQDFLSVGEVDALFAPPSWNERVAFAARHFTGGLPESALPVESLYRPGGRSAADARFGAAGGRMAQPGAGGAYDGDAARYMRTLIARMGLAFPPEFAACPDHLALELDLVAVMLRSGMTHQAQSFLVERLAWLASYRMRLVLLEDDARFYIGLVDVLLGVWSRFVVFEGAGAQGASASGDVRAKARDASVSASAHI